MVWPLECLVYLFFVYSMRSHIHASNRGEGDWFKKTFGSTQSMVGWYMEVPNLVGSFIC